jgi:hypothetical protein
MDKSSKQHEQLKGQIAALKAENKELEHSHGNKLKKEQRSLRDENERLKTMYEAELRRTKDGAALASREAAKREEKSTKQFAALNAQMQQNHEDWNKSYKHLEGIKTDLERSLSRAKSDEESRVIEVEDAWEKRLSKEQRRHADEVQKLRLEIDRQKAALAKERSHNEEELRTQEEALTKRHEQEKEGLRHVIEDFKSSSAQREHFKGLTDSEMATLFKRLAIAIEDFRLDWDFRKEEDWPCSEDQLRQLHSKNPRKLKQQIVQNTLWVLLYDHIFRSPFRIFGVDGREYDTHWIKIYSSGE